MWRGGNSDLLKSQGCSGPASQGDSQHPHTDGPNMETPEITSSPGAMAKAQGAGRVRESLTPAAICSVR